MQPGLLGAISPEEQRGLLEPYERPQPGSWAGLLGPPLRDRMAEASQDQRARWDAGQRSPTPLTEDNMWLADDVAGSFLGPVGAMGAIKAFHGSPHRFDRFSMDKIGTGEGAQAYGHGLYFAESEGVARSYRDQLSASFGRTPRAINTATDLLEEQFLNKVGSFTKGGTALEEAKKMALRDTLENVHWHTDLLKKQGLTEADATARLTEYAKNYDAGGALYTTRLNVEPDDLLDWDLPLSQQSEKVRGAVFDAYKAAMTRAGRGKEASLVDALPSDWASKTGDQIYRAIGVDPAVGSQALREAGIPGIRYLDQGSRTAGEGTRNFVIFDDSLVEIEGLL